MTITAKIICDTTTRSDYDDIIGSYHFGNNKYDFADRLVTLQLRYPRFIHSEVMTHRVFSRNASSSRAIPVNKLIEDVLRDTAMPIHWGKNIPGMQAKEEHNDYIILRGINDDLECSNKEAWLVARDHAIEVAHAFAKAGYHKQIVNRLLEPFSHINVIVTSNQWKNFFNLRYHEDAQPEIYELARVMKEAIDNSTPKFLRVDEWHLPYITTEDVSKVFNLHLVDNYGPPLINKVNTTLAKISVARCARVSYLTHEGKVPSIEADLALFEDLITSEPMHASPSEHQALVTERLYNTGNFSNFAQSYYYQFRKMLESKTYVNEINNKE